MQVPKSPMVIIQVSSFSIFELQIYKRKFKSSSEFKRKVRKVFHNRQASGQMIFNTLGL